MVRLRKLYLDGKLLECPHPFEDEIDWVVRTNHRLVFESISRIEGEAEPDEIEDGYSNELRRAANSLALVGLVTTLHHWISIFVEELTKENATDRSLVRNLKTLDERTGVSPIPIQFFEELVTVRDSIIHAHSQIQWTFRHAREVPQRYADTASGEVQFTEADLNEAIQKSITLVKVVRRPIRSSRSV